MAIQVRETFHGKFMDFWTKAWYNEVLKKRIFPPARRRCPPDGAAGREAGSGSGARKFGGLKLKREILGVAFDDLTRQEAAQRGRELLEEDKFH